jgi:hypothetical protein
MTKIFGLLLSTLVMLGLVTPGAQADTGIRESYLATIRRDGVAKHADMVTPHRKFRYLRDFQEAVQAEIAAAK